MSHPFNQFGIKYVWRIVLLLVLVLMSVYQLYQWQIKETRSQEFLHYQSYLNEKVKVLIKQKQYTTQALAVALMAPPDFKKALIEHDESIQSQLKRFTKQLSNLTEYKNIWIQLVDANGISIARSWTEKKGDSLMQARKDIASVVTHPRRINTFSVGKFALTFKSIVPLYDDNKRFIGLVDVISHVNSIDKAILQTDGVRSVVLVDKKYRNQLTNADTNMFIDDYYVANKDVSEGDLALLQRLGIEEVVNANNYQLFEDYLIVVKPIMDMNGEPMASWIALKPLDRFEFINIRKAQKQFFFVTIFVAVLLALLAAMIFFKRQADFEKRFFFQVFNTSSEIVYVTDRTKLVFANQQFFEFFDEFKTLKEFHAKYQCVCDLFIEEEGFLKRYMGDVFWYDYVIQHIDVPHYAKIHSHGRDHIFLVKAAEITGNFGKDYMSILMTDITEEERYKTELEHLIVHDELTGIYNRHYFNQFLEEEVRRHHRYQTPFSMISLDIDHFKNINDTYGHDVGDSVLISLSKEVAEQLRESDVFCRVGGEEFMVMMPETELENAINIAERIRIKVEAIPSRDVPEKITVSLGVVELTQWDNLHSFYKRADNALYKAKENGRNRVEVITD